LDVVITSFVSLDEVFKGKWHIPKLKIAAMAQLVRYISGYILRPMFGSVEGDDPNRVLVLTLKQIGDHRFQICSLDVGFRVNPPVSAKIVDHKVHGLIVRAGYD
jgi:hypothetical protein